MRRHQPRIRVNAAARREFQRLGVLPVPPAPVPSRPQGAAR